MTVTFPEHVAGTSVQPEHAFVESETSMGGGGLKSNARGNDDIRLRPSAYS